jgi:nitrogen fixation/metabolism regulation signal transduction histidine kinase
MTHKPAKPSYKRKQYWVDAPLQLQMVFFVLILISASLALTAFSVHGGIQQTSNESHEFFHSIEWIDDAIRAPLILSSTISLLVAGLLTLFWSHRFAGPLRVISAGIARVRHGNLAVPVRVRVTDAHQEFAGEFQKMQEELRKMIEKDRAHVAAAVAGIEAAEKALEQELEPDEYLAKALSELKQACTQYHL